MNIELRKKAKMILKFFFLKLMKNSVFGKTLENVRKHRDNKVITMKQEGIVQCQNQSII